MANIGDSRMIVAYKNQGIYLNKDKWGARQTTCDHKPDVPEERERILKNGGLVQ